MILAHKIALDPYHREETYFCRAAGIRQYHQTGSIFVDPGGKHAPQMAFIHLGQAFKNFFAGILCSDLEYLDVCPAPTDHRPGPRSGLHCQGQRRPERGRDNQKS